jgi:hypothetical protein
VPRPKASVGIERLATARRFSLLLSSVGNRKEQMKYKRQESVRDFKARLVVMLAQERGLMPKPHAALLRPKGSAPTPSEVMGGAKMPKLRKPPKRVGKWLKSLGVKV